MSEPPTATPAPPSNENIVIDDAGEETILALIEEHVKEVRYIEAAKVIQTRLPKEKWTSDHVKYIEMGQLAKTAMANLLESPKDNDDYWKKQGESHGHRDTMIHYHVDDQIRLTCRIETPIESSLLSPLLSVFNESDLFDTWMPQWKFPRVGIKDSRQLGDWGRGHQLISICVQLPSPMANREVIQHAFAVDAIDSDNSIVIKGISRESMDGLISPPQKGVTRMDFQAGIVIRPCPPNHHLLAKSKANYPADEKLLLISLEQFVDPHLAGVPQSLQNFFTRTFMAKLWGSLLQVAEEVRANQRPKHAAAIANKKELYDWVDQRVQVMFDKMIDNHDE